MDVCYDVSEFLYIINSNIIDYLSSSFLPSLVLVSVPFQNPFFPIVFSKHTFSPTFRLCDLFSHSIDPMGRVFLTVTFFLIFQIF